MRQIMIPQVVKVSGPNGEETPLNEWLQQNGYVQLTDTSVATRKYLVVSVPQERIMGYINESDLPKLSQFRAGADDATTTYLINGRRYRLTLIEPCFSDFVQ